MTSIVDFNPRTLHRRQPSIQPATKSIQSHFHFHPAHHTARQRIAFETIARDQDHTRFATRYVYVYVHVLQNELLLWSTCFRSAFYLRSSREQHVLREDISAMQGKREEKNFGAKWYCTVQKI